ncbi:MAG: IS21 family transposase [Rhodoferax sp.]|uniref:IS21 family transposase n=1 Tax=Rhodoferax sp. TaxID=50421 RepID=UPI00326306C7
MGKIREVLRLALESHLSVRAISRSLGLSRDVVNAYLVRAANAKLLWPLPHDMDDAALELCLFLPSLAGGTRLPEPDWAEVHRELQRSGATLTAQHAEYLAIHLNGMQRSHFCAKYRHWAKHLKSYLRQTHIAGECVFVDYAGPTMEVHDAASGQVLKAQIFVAVLGASNYTYAEATWSQRLPDWIAANVRMLEFFDCVPSAIVCDNLKSGVTKASLTEPLVNESYQAFAAHYRTTVVPTRPRRPKDKPKAEGGVLIVERWIIFKLRKRVFTSLGELNEAIRELLRALNNSPFQKLPGSRRSTYLSLDKPAMRPLPSRPYEYAEFRRARVGMDREVAVDGRGFSVPAALVGKVVDLRVTAGVVEILFGGRRIASHVRSPGHQSVIDPAHLPKADQAYGLWTPERETAWASTIGPNTRIFTSERLAQSANKTTGYRWGLGLRKLVEAFGAERLESTCAKALRDGAIRLKSLQVILEKNLDLASPEVTDASFIHENVRGPDYYH